MLNRVESDSNVIGARKVAVRLVVRVGFRMWFALKLALKLDLKLALKLPFFLKISDTKSLFTIIELNAIKKGFKEVLIY